MKCFRNTSWLFGEKILRMIVGLFTVIATLGLDGIVVRELVKDESKRNVLWS
jgi:O-antigen/teichoic acid export membrane protein